MVSACENTASGSQPRAPEAHMQASPVTPTPEGPAGPVANTDGISNASQPLISIYIDTILTRIDAEGGPSPPTATTAPTLPTPPTETQPQTQDLRLCSKKC